MHATLTAPPSVRDARGAQPLLPSALSSPQAYVWLWVVPIAVLLLLNGQAYWIVEGNMSADQHFRALMLALAGVVNLLAGIATAVWVNGVRGRGMSLPVPLVAGATTLLVQVTYLWFACDSSGEAIPRSVATWIYSPERFVLNQLSFAMLPLCVGLLQLACIETVVTSGRVLGAGLLAVLLVPVGMYVAFHGLKMSAERVAGMVIATGFVVVGLAIFVGIARAIMWCVRQAHRLPGDADRVAVLLFAFVGPMLGLLLNQGIAFPVDFQAPEVYALVGVNAVVLFTASWQHLHRPWLSFYLLCATLPFSLYFFIVFLPYLPLSIIAMLAAGLGVLILMPTLLFALHAYLLVKSYRNLRRMAAWPHVALNGAACALLLPGFFVGRAWADKVALHSALDYLYAPAINSRPVVYDANRANLRRALDSHRAYKDGIHYPLLSDFYSWFVFNHLVLPDDKLARIEAVFFGQTPEEAAKGGLRAGQGFFQEPRSGVRRRMAMPRAVPPPRSVVVSRLALDRGRATAEANVLTLALTLQNNAPSPGEFIAHLPLPSGVFVSGFRLHIDGVPVPGRIVEKKTALWVYTMIRDMERRDPGLLFYNTATELELRVFPVDPRKPSVVEVDFMLPSGTGTEGIDVAANDPAAVLRALAPRIPAVLAPGTRGTVLAGNVFERPLPTVARAPYLHIIVDRSKAGAYGGDLRAPMAAVRERYPAARLGRLTFAHHDVVHVVSELTPLDQLMVRAGQYTATAMAAEGGLAADLALAEVLRLHRERDLDGARGDGDLPRRLVVVLISGSSAPRMLEFGLAEQWRDLAPDMEAVEVGADGFMRSLVAAGGGGVSLLRLGKSMRVASAGRAVRFAPQAGAVMPEYWSPTEGVWRKLDGLGAQAVSSPWTAAADLQGLQQDYARNPGGTGFDLAALVGASRECGVLIPATSYIVVENAAQWRMLEIGERQKLSQNAALAFRETPAPPAVWVAAGFAGWCVWRRRRKG